ncbi:TetR family transcriptional regulator C-terminal domain-containing protein [Streptomyces coeruleorubidus]|uniref:TetR family transcriptional regulator C-terminal domain-containing protein n=2 Tax=Streptomyces coeruleorubidus TaxID=116188 RepID=A0ABZ0K8F8_STRC4|nr:TetR family transcriptional regulator C-terminal domain-containing protein [Streptomyces coeruleorubidus]WOT34263.1 TetR family transcriptional regulator C-terminal domain-containing protein [Streptomyces coeruleorubidus]
MEKGRTKAAARQESRNAMLKAGAEILHRVPVGDVLSQVKATNVAKLANRTTGSFYNIWVDHEAYLRDLIRYVLEPSRFDAVTQVIKEEITRQEGASYPELIKSVAEKNFTALKGDPFMSLQLALWAKRGSDHEMTEHLRALYRSLNDKLIPVYDDLLKDLGRRMRPPYKVEHLAVALMALLEGLHIRSEIDAEAVPEDLGASPEGVEYDPAHPWGLFAAAAYALIEAMTTESPEGSDMT